MKIMEDFYYKRKPLCAYHKINTFEWNKKEDCYAEVMLTSEKSSPLSSYACLKAPVRQAGSQSGRQSVSQLVGQYEFYCIIFLKMP